MASRRKRLSAAEKRRRAKISAALKKHHAAKRRAARAHQAKLAERRARAARLKRERLAQGHIVGPLAHFVSGIDTEQSHATIAKRHRVWAQARDEVRASGSEAEFRRVLDAVAKFLLLTDEFTQALAES